jgi:putative endonuclease
VSGSHGSGKPVRRTSSVQADRSAVSAARAMRDAEVGASLGALGEALVADAYQHAGYTVLERNWRTPNGELDLIVTRDGTVVFCEVKTRTSHGFGSPAEAVTRDKRERIRALASEWLAHNRGAAKQLRFDVAAVTARPDAETEIEIIEGAF